MLSNVLKYYVGCYTYISKKDFWAHTSSSTPLLLTEVSTVTGHIYVC